MPQSPYLPEDVASARHIVARGHRLLAGTPADQALEIRATAWAVLVEDRAALHPAPAPTAPARVIRIPLAVFQAGRRKPAPLHIAQPTFGGDAA